MKIRKKMRSFIKLLRNNTGKTFSDINLSNIFLSKPPKAKEIKAKLIVSSRTCVDLLPDKQNCT